MKMILFFVFYFGLSTTFAQDLESSGVLGPDKGVLAKSEEGFKLSPEAKKTFNLKVKSFKELNHILPKEALLLIKNEKYFYRVRNNWIKRVDLKSGPGLKKILSEIQDQDEIVVSGVPFLRIAEIFAENGHDDEHSH